MEGLLEYPQDKRQKRQNGRKNNYQKPYSEPSGSYGDTPFMKSIQRGCKPALVAVAVACACSSALADRIPMRDLEPGFDRPALVAKQGGMTDRIIVKYKDGSQAVGKTGHILTTKLSQASSYAGQPMKLWRKMHNGAQVLKMNARISEREAAKLAAQLALDPDVEYAEPDRIMKPFLTPNDSQYSSQWHYFESTGGLNAPAAWDITNGAGVVVAVLDTGYRPHADLNANLLAGYDMISDSFVGNDGNGRDSDARDPGDWILANECGGTHAAQDSSWHGTHVAGTIAAVTNNGSGVAGVAYGAKVVPVRVLGKCGGYTSDIADGIIWASGGTVSGVPANANPAKVINMSLGGSGACDTTTQNAINSARSRGTVVVIAAGNDNANANNFNPGNCAGVINVAATNRSGGRAYYSNYGTSVDVAAPGGAQSSFNDANGVLSTWNSGTTTPGSDSYIYMQGTSMAAPHVAGVAALIAKVKPTATPDEIESILKTTTRTFPASCSGCGTGIVNALAAVQAAQGTGGGGTTINESESNNTTSTADQISTSGTTVNGNMGSSSDTDYFKLSLPAGKTLTATLTPNASSDYDLIVYNSNGTEIGRSEKGTGQVDAVTVTNTGTSTFTRYVRVVYYSGGTGSTNGKYTLKTTW
ncbi:serine protease [Permianibacter aggregans]|uniref:Serine protease n=2 Tax=Permianibacter aggregans TaxID=1510150 RepID=A0A4R6UTU1_9GAMM|nr:serine protease [Permianibacter aggregans]